MKRFSSRILGDVILRQSLDRERKDFYMIPVMAQDKGGRTSFTSVYVNVKDVNDNAPQFYATSMCPQDLNVIETSQSLCKLCQAWHS